jgi:hypothetical protein
MKWRPRFRNFFKESGSYNDAKDFVKAINSGESGDDFVVQPPLDVPYPCDCGGSIKANSIHCDSCKKVARDVSRRGEQNPVIQIGTTVFTDEPWFKEMWPNYARDYSQNISIMQAPAKWQRAVTEAPRRRESEQSAAPAPKAFNSGERKPTLGEIVGAGSNTAPVAEAPSYSAPTEGPGSNWHPVIQNAIDKGHELELVYQGAKDNEGTQRVIIPTGMGPGRQPGITALRAFDPNAGVHKEFRTDRIVKMLDSRPSSVQPIPVDPEPLATGVSRTTAQPSSVQQSAQQSKNQAAGWIIESPTLKPSVNEKTGDIEPTDDEYAELKALDIDPDTHDKATVRRLRNNGATHAQLIEVAGEHGLPLEDYEQALQNNNGNHALAVQEAQHYRSLDNDQIQQNRERNRDFPNYAESRTLSDSGHEANASALFVHHLNLKNAPEFGGMYKDLPGRRRASEWILSELSKVQPSLKGKIKSKFFKTLETLQGDDTPRIDGGANMNYFRLVNELDKHHGALMATATSLKDLTKQRRIRKALVNIGNARFYPNDYSADVYEED